MTDSDLTKYDWRRRLGDGGSGVYFYSAIWFSTEIIVYLGNGTR